MKTLIITRLLTAVLLLLTGATTTAWAQGDTAATPTEAEADSLRQTDGFVTASVLVTSPGQEGYSSLGHCALRMECPVYGLDYCFSFEMNMGSAAADYLAFFSGDTPAGFVAMNTPAYLQRFKDEGRGIVQYTLNLTPQQKQELWRRLDENMMEGINSHFDFFFHNCTSMCLMALQSQLVGERMEVREWPEVMRHGVGNSCLFYTRQTSWLQFVMMTIMGTKADEEIPLEQCVSPEVIGEVLSHAVIVSPDGSERPALIGEARQLQPQTLILSHSWFTPLFLALTLLALVVLLTAGQWLLGWRRLALTADVVFLVMQALIGAVLLYLVVVSRLLEQPWNWCLLIFSPLPLVAWLCCRRRSFYRRLSLLYGVALLLLAVAAPLITLQLIAAHRFVAAAIAVRCFSCVFDIRLIPIKKKKQVNKKNNKSMKTKPLFHYLRFLLLFPLLASSLQTFGGDVIPSEPMINNVESAEVKSDVISSPTGLGKVYVSEKEPEDAIFPSSHYENEFGNKNIAEGTYLHYWYKKDENDELSKYYFLGWSKKAAATKKSDIFSMENYTTLGVTSNDITSSSSSLNFNLFFGFYYSYEYYYTINVYANFSRVQVLSANESQGTACLLDSKFQVMDGDVVRLKATSNLGYKFMGWKKGDGTEFVSTQNPLIFTVGDETAGIYTAYFQESSSSAPHNVTIENGHGTMTADLESASAGETVTLTVAPETGYEAASVKYDDIEATKVDDTHYSFTMPNDDVYVSLICTPIHYSIHYDLRNGTNNGKNPAFYTIESDDITLKEPTRGGGLFLGWEGTGLDAPTKSVTITKGSTGNRSYTATWTDQFYNVYFDGNGSTDDSMPVQGIPLGEAQELYACQYTRTGYTFAGWNTEADGTGTGYADGASVQDLTDENWGSVTLYAQWTPNTYTVHFDANHELASGTMDDQVFTYDQEATALTANVFYMETGDFNGWNTEADGSGDSYDDQEEVQNLLTENGTKLTLYAQWKNVKYPVEYDTSVFTCRLVNDENQVVESPVYWALPEAKIKVSVNDVTSQHTITVTGDDGDDITFDTSDNTFIMPNQRVWITSTVFPKIAFTTIYLDGYTASEDVAYLYDAEHPTVTPTVVVRKGYDGDALTEGTDYDLSFKNNVGSPNQMVTATVTVTGKGDWVGTNTGHFRITPFNIANCKIKGTLEAFNDGYGLDNALAENMEVWNGNKKLTRYDDYALGLEDAAFDDPQVGQTFTATITGKGDWGGSQSFTFKAIDLYHTVVFDANGGTGTMKDSTVTRNSRYYLPVCEFTAPLGKRFDHWEVSCENEGDNKIKYPGNYFTGPTAWYLSDVQTITVKAIWAGEDVLALLNDDSKQPAGSKNADVIAKHADGTVYNVLLSARTLYADGDWNTLCLPFNVEGKDLPSGVTFMQLDVDGTYDADGKASDTGTNRTGFDSTTGTLNLYFKNALTSQGINIPAGTPFLVKWDEPGTDITDLILQGMTLVDDEPAPVASKDGCVEFVGTYSTVDIFSADNNNLYLGSNNNLYYPWAENMTSFNINAFRAYFHLNGLTAGEVATTRMVFGESEQTGIKDNNRETITNSRYFDLQGRPVYNNREQIAPLKKGLYIVNGKKIVMK